MTAVSGRIGIRIKNIRRYGIEFGDFSIGDSVDFLDTTVYLDEEGLLQHKLYRKPTDSRLYLKTHSFHAAHVFGGIAHSQMMRVKRRNSIFFFIWKFN